MGLTYAQGLVFLLSASLLTASLANKEWQYGSNYTDSQFNHNSHNLNYTNGPRKITVGGSMQWTFGFNYTDWALKNGPFYLSDTLVFKYDPPSENNTHPHSVYLLPNYSSFLKCDLSRAKMIANTTQGGGEGFEFALKSWQPYYFACGASNGVHCNIGLMKFPVMPLLPPWRY